MITPPAPTAPTPAGPTRRRVLTGVLTGAGVALAAPATVGLTGAAASAEVPAPECLASLVQEGELTYGDLMAG